MKRKSFTAALILLVFFVVIVNSHAKEVQNNQKTSVLHSKQCSTFTFDATESYDPDHQQLAFNWDFGDGSTSYQPVVTHTYQKSGEYTVTLEAKDPSELECNSRKTSTKIQANHPPRAWFTAPTFVCKGDRVEFDASKTKSDHLEGLIYSWSFGDGNKNQGQIVQNSYIEPGAYTAKLIVDDQSDGECNMDSVEKTIHVNEAPRAVVKENVVFKCLESKNDYEVTFNASDSYDKNRSDKLSFFWDFGDGTQGEGKIVSHKYPGPGNYGAKLSLHDNSSTECSVTEEKISVILSKKPTAHAGKDVNVCLGTSVPFSGEHSDGEQNEYLLATWDFGDNTQEPGLVTTHDYQYPGRYKATLTVTSSNNPNCPQSVDSRYVTVNAPPKVKIYPITKILCTDKRVAFDATSSGDPDGDRLEYFWNFGDGNIIRGGPRIQHEYKKGGTFEVTVIADDNKNSSCSSASDTILVKINTPPVADPGENVACCVGKEADFSAKNSSDPDGDALTYKWEFGDGNSSTSPNSKHIYKKSGKFNVRLTVDDNTNSQCSSSSVQFLANVNQPPVPIIKVK